MTTEEFSRIQDANFHFSKIQNSMNLSKGHMTITRFLINALLIRAERRGTIRYTRILTI